MHKSRKRSFTTPLRHKINKYLLIITKDSAYGQDSLCTGYGYMPLRFFNNLGIMINSFRIGWSPRPFGSEFFTHFQKGGEESPNTSLVYDKSAELRRQHAELRRNFLRPSALSPRMSALSPTAREEIVANDHLPPFWQ